MAELTAEATRTQIEKILQNRIFRNSEALRNLLTYLADKSISGTSDCLKEYTIALEVFGRPASFDPRQESVVRMHSARLRQKLGEYYYTDGSQDPIVVDLPKGGFRMTFQERVPAEPPPLPVAAQVPAVLPPPPVVQVQQPVPAEIGRHSWWVSREALLSLFLGIAVSCGAYFGVRVWQVDHAGRTVEAAASWSPELQELWKPFLSSNQPLVVCIATPMFAQVPGFGLVRQSSSNWDDAAESTSVSAVKTALHAKDASPSYDYTGVGTASGAFLLGQFLAPRKQSVLVSSSNLVSWTDLTGDNVVFLGPMAATRQIQDIPMDLRILFDSTGVRNLGPRAGEPAFLADSLGQPSSPNGVSYALISRIPGMNGRGAILMISGNQNSGVMGGVQAFTNPSLAQVLVSKMKTSSGSIPQYFQVVLKVKSMENVPVDISYVFHREIPQSPQIIAQR